MVSVSKILDLTLCRTENHQPTPCFISVISTQQRIYLNGFKVKELIVFYVLMPVLETVNVFHYSNGFHRMYP